tara:strand:- start:12752 stop:13093 length:342 start_codon:yes stop_codon:yes gene_type:complete
MKLMIQDKNIELANKVSVADSLVKRCMGLMGKKELDQQECLWIKSCNQIHTHFMRFAIDAVFVNKDMQVLKVKTDIKPWRFTLPVLGADSVFEFNAQKIGMKVQEGDYLYVGT